MIVFCVRRQISCLIKETLTKIHARCNRLRIVVLELTGPSLPNNLHQHALLAPTVKLTIKDLLPRAEVELSFSDGDHHFAAHDGAFEMGVGVVFAGVVVAVLIDGRVGCEAFEPFVEVVMQTALVVVNEDAGADVHGVDEAEIFANAAFGEGGFNVGCDIEIRAAVGRVEPEFFTVVSHGGAP